MLYCPGEIAVNWYPKWKETKMEHSSRNAQSLTNPAIDSPLPRWHHIKRLKERLPNFCILFNLSCQSFKVAFWQWKWPSLSYDKILSTEEMTLQAKLWCLCNDCSCLSMIFTETKSLWRMRNTTTSPYKKNLYPPNSRIISRVPYVTFSGSPSPWFFSNFWIAFPRDTESHSSRVAKVLRLVLFLLMNHILLTLNNLCCPLKIPQKVPQAACLPQCHLYLSPSIMVPAYIYLATQMPAVLCLRTLQQTQSVPRIISWSWTPISYDGLKTVCLSKVICKFA